jgi:PAS domain S-box-containing protein
MDGTHSIIRNRWGIALALWLPLGLTLLLAVFQARGRAIRNNDFTWVIHTVRVEARLEHIDFLVKDAEVSEQEYIATGNPALLAAYDKAVQAVPAETKVLARLIADNPTQVAALARLELLITHRLAGTAHALWLARPPPPIGVTAQAGFGFARSFAFDGIRPLVAAMTAEEDRLLVLRRQALARQIQVETWVTRGIVVVDGALVASLTVFLWFSMRSRRRSEALAQATEARYRSMFECAPDGVVIASPDGRFIDASPSLGRMLGYTPAELVGQHVAIMVAEAEHGEISPVINEIKAGEQHHREWHFRRRDGSKFSVDTVATLLPDGNIFSMVCDITDRKRAEARFRRVVESNAQAVYFWDRSGRITNANDAFLALVGYSREDLLAGRIDWRSLTPPEQAQLDDRALVELSEHGTAKPFEKSLIRRDGTRVPVLIGSALFEDDPNAGMSFAIDLTERKSLEQQFLRAQRMEGIGTLAGGIAHDLNNILTPIMLSVELLKLTAVDPQAKRVLETIAVSTKRGADIVRQVLSFARGLDGERVAIEPRSLLQELEHIIKDTFPKAIRLKFVLPPTGTILGDPTQVHQILLNLCINARDAMPGGGDLTIGVEDAVVDEVEAAANRVKPGRYIVLSVADSGTGMSPELLAKIFDPFFTTKQLHQGTGLGLSTVMAILKSHGGMVKVRTEPGQGTTFRIYLPANEAAVGAEATAEPPSLPRGRGEQILVVDDEAAILSVTSETLQSFGYRVVTAVDGAEAIAVYAQHRHEIALVLTDMSMPIMDGEMTIAALIRINPAVKIVAASGIASAPVADLDRVSGINHFLKKPYTSATLLTVVRTILDQA